MKEIRVDQMIELIAGGVPIIFMRWIDSPFINQYEAVDYFKIETKEDRLNINKRYGNDEIEKIDFKENFEIKINGYNCMRSGIIIYLKREN